MPAEFGGVACPKPLPRKVEKLLKQKAEKRDDGKERDEIRKFYKRRCCVCGRKTNTVHENKRRGAGGLVDLSNSFLACDIVDGGVCHPLLQARQIEPLVNRVPLTLGGDVRAITGFRMNSRTHRLAFSHRSTPTHIEIQD